MKTKLISLLLLFTLITFGGCLPGKVIKGDGNVVTKEVPVSDYTKVQAAGSITINYSQSDEEPYLQVVTDQNIFDSFEFIVNNDGALQIRPKKEFRRNTNFRPTEFTINTNSRAIAGFDMAGNSKLNVNSTIRSEGMRLSLAGSGNINLNHKAEVNKMTVEIAGSATMNAFELASDEFRGDIAGSGTLNLGGEGRKATFSIAGSGDVKGIEFVVDEMKCDIAGSGYIEIHANKSINVSVAGSGRVRYKGDPTISRSVVGSGSVKKIEE